MNTKLSIFYAAVILAAGCVPSLHPLYTDKDVIFEEKLLGRWEDDNNASNAWIFEKGSDPNSYKLNIRENDKDGYFDAHLTKIEDSMYLDLFPQEPQIEASDYYKMHLLGVHTFLKIEIADPNLHVRAMNPEFIEELIKSNPDAVKHEVLGDKNDGIVLTASTEQLRKFIAKYENEKDFLGDITELEPMAPAEEKVKTPSEINTP